MDGIEPLGVGIKTRGMGTSSTCIATKKGLRAW